ncbi:MAG: hypothetical protein A2Y73_05570 [Chloroflexi bacterium RBG_13_56_8]|nr:MAG: hypothetical protein A2Y73_05570 [Chloroflexi bacterium RBG_13_56_8]
MPDDARYIAGGAVIGAIIGAFGVWMYMHYVQKPAENGREQIRGRVERGQLMRLGWSVIGIIRQILELG